MAEKGRGALPGDLVRGRDATLTRAFHAFLAHGEPVRAARTAFWLAFMLSHTGDLARAGGWTARAINRLQGDVAEAERAYQRASEAGRTPQPASRCSGSHKAGETPRVPQSPAS